MERIEVVIMLDEDVNPPMYGIYEAKRPLQILNGFDCLHFAIAYCDTKGYKIVNELGEN